MEVEDDNKAEHTGEQGIEFVAIVAADAVAEVVGYPLVKAHE